MWEKNTHAVVLRPIISSDIEPQEPENLGGSLGETEPRRHANCDGTIIRLLRVRDLHLGVLEQRVRLPSEGALHPIPNMFLRFFDVV